MTTDPSADWAAVLDAFEAGVALQRAALASGDLDRIVPFEPPAGIGALPPALHDRAAAALAESNAVLALAIKARAAIKARLDADPPTPAPAPRQRAPRVASYLDARV